MSGGMRLNAGRQTVQCSHGLVEAVCVILRHLHRLQLFEPCLLGYLVFALVCIVLQMTHVGDITHVANLVSDVLKVTEEQVERDGGTSMSQMCVAVNRRATHVHTHSPFVQGTEKFLATSQSVIDEKCLFHILSFSRRKGTKIFQNAVSTAAIKYTTFFC